MKIKGIASTRQVYVDGIELILERSQGYLNLSPEGFAWGDEGRGSAQLAFAVLLEHYGAPIRVSAKVMQKSQNAHIQLFRSSQY